jgi:hypothetical protein
MATNYRPMDCESRHVFAVLANGWLYPGWVVGASRMRGVDEAWPAAGSALHHSFGIWPVLLNDATSMLEWDPPRHALLKARAWPVGEAHVTMDVRPTTSGCVVRMIEDTVAGPARFVPGALRESMVHARNVETLHRLAYLAEGKAKAERKAADGTA